MDEYDFYMDQRENKAAAEAGFTLDVSDPFTSIDALKLYSEYEIYLDQSGDVATDWAVAFWSTASKSLLNHEFHELFQRVELLRHSRWLDRLKT